MRLLVSLLAVAAVFAAGLLLAAGRTDNDRPPAKALKARPASPALAGDLGTSSPEIAKRVWRGPRHLTALVRRSTALRDRPRGRAIARLAALTRWKSPRVMFVAKRRAGWLGVIAPELGNGRIGWIPRRAARLYPISWELRADLSARRVTVMHAGRVVRRVPVAIGSASTPTPTGRFAVTDKLVVKVASPYGCCILALSAHQPNIPQGWGGGDRIALHATSNEASVGSAASHGCLRARARDMKVLVRDVPLGTPIYIRA